MRIILKGHILNIGGDSIRPSLVYYGNCYPLFVLFFKYVSIVDALLSSLLDPLEGLSMVNCGKWELGGRSRLPTLKGVRGAC